MRLPKVFSRSRKEKGEDRADGVSVSELIPKGSRIVLKNPGGFLVSFNGHVELVPLKEHEVWGSLSPLFMAQEVEELWLFEGKTIASIKGVGRVSIEGVPLPEELENIVVKIIAATGVRVDMRHPRGVADLGEWRVSLQLSTGGRLQVVATRLAQVPALADLVDPLVAARLLLLLLRPSVVVILGPPGAGKSTLLNSLVREVAVRYPFLHIAVVEKYRELVFRDGWFSWIVSENLVDGVRFAMRYYRPDVLVVGEIMAEDVWSIVEPGRAGLPTITTFHSPTTRKAVKVLSDALRANLGYGDENSALHYVDVFVQMRKKVTPGGVERGVESVFLSDGQRLVPIYAEGNLVSDEEFLKAMPDQLYVGSLEQTVVEVYSSFGLKQRRQGT
ncbi:Flp pilus assembly complex ATPase component TadA [Infirmifilum lucidum]|uniref:Flp pilus assembly complex ATPase component TadA n=1 Tax=Infirmifilum lucidum TaxID=2776706 RepID=A0A7L9FLA1_9CREN|nr:ATPase, T2SS/T4P/T4SS family [Infirmifilum lucidum]QOJ79646.1 Flp pilus assembly complex ATPase component TadA [Infirmifilum lucidum]